MDLRFYHDGLGQDTYAEQLEALEITYEDYEPGYGDARGVARTHELVVDAFDATPGHEELAARARTCALPPLLRASPQRLRDRSEERRVGKEGRARWGRARETRRVHRK